MVIVDAFPQPHISGLVLSEVQLGLEREGHVRYTARSVPLHSDAEARVYAAAYVTAEYLEPQLDKWAAIWNAPALKALRATRSVINCILQAFDMADAAARRATIVSVAALLPGMRNTTCRSGFRPKGVAAPGTWRPGAAATSYVSSQQERDATAAAWTAFCTAFDALIAGTGVLARGH